MRYIFNYHKTIEDGIERSKNNPKFNFAKQVKSFKFKKVTEDLVVSLFYTIAYKKSATNYIKHIGISDGIVAIAKRIGYHYSDMEEWRFNLLTEIVSNDLNISLDILPSKVNRYINLVNQSNESDYTPDVLNKASKISTGAEYYSYISSIKRTGYFTCCKCGETFLAEEAAKGEGICKRCKQKLRKPEDNESSDETSNCDEANEANEEVEVVPNYMSNIDVINITDSLDRVIKSINSNIDSIKNSVDSEELDDALNYLADYIFNSFKNAIKEIYKK